MKAVAAPLLACFLVASHTPASAEVRSLKLFNIHTKETASIVFKRNGAYDAAGLKQINTFLRDWREEKVTKIDPRLLDLVWEAYRATGARQPIHVVCGYRSPETNSMLRRRSSGVAKNSLHMDGKALDFYIPGVSLAKLREVGLRLEEGGVGYYPTSGAPFVHMDTGSVRHWPRMSRQQLVKVFPNGKTLHIPSDGKPLPGYQQALAAYKARQRSGTSVAIAALNPPALTKRSAKAAAPLVIASAMDPDEEEDNLDIRTPTPAPRRAVAVAVASYSTAPTPRRRPAPQPAEPQVLAAVAAPPAPTASAPAHKPAPTTVALARSMPAAPDFDFGSPHDWAQPAVPANLAEAMAARDHTRRGASRPIAPTAVVATVNVSRPLRAAAITTAVLRTNDETPADDMPQVLAYAPVEAFDAPSPARTAGATAAGLPPLPQPSPLRTASLAKSAPTTAVRPAAPAPAVAAPKLTLTSLDTQGLRMWIGPDSTRQKRYALLTMPDFAQAPDLMAKPGASFGAGFGETAYDGLRTDRFAGPLVVQPDVIDFRLGPMVTAAR